MRIKEISDVEFAHTWDLEVPQNHEYLLSNGVVSHNTSQLLGNRESVEPIHSNYYVRSTGTGIFPIPNKYLEEVLEKYNINIEEAYKNITENNGSVSNLNLPENIKDVFKTVWELSQIELAKMSQERMNFIDQSESHNVFISDPTYSKLSSYHFASWVLGLKTGMYYLKMQTEKAQDFTKTDKETPKKSQKKNIVCTDEVCTVCSS
jgi:ribonucleoside-diphosphate reductase subunit M1